jgi:hypothetical protein
MTDQEQKDSMKAMIAELLNKAQPAQPSTGWGTTPQTSVNEEPDSISIPVSVQAPGGKVRTYWNYDRIPATPENVLALLEKLINKGVPVDIWQAKDNAWGGKQGWKRN